VTRKIAESNWQDAFLTDPDKLRCAADLAEKLTTFGHLPVEQLLEMLLDLGLLFSNFDSDWTQQASNLEVFEDPLDRRDSLGNVLMIHKRPKRPAIDQSIVNRIGEILMHVHQQAVLHTQSSNRAFQENEEDEYLLDQQAEYDICSSENSLPGGCDQPKSLSERRQLRFARNLAWKLQRELSVALRDREIATLRANRKEKHIKELQRQLKEHLGGTLG
jgi:hypothetical protein